MLNDSHIGTDRPLSSTPSRDGGHSHRVCGPFNGDTLTERARPTRHHRPCSEHRRLRMRLSWWESDPEWRMFGVN